MFYNSKEVMILCYLSFSASSPTQSSGLIWAIPSRTGTQPKPVFHKKILIIEERGCSPRSVYFPYKSIQASNIVKLFKKKGNENGK